MSDAAAQRRARQNIINLSLSLVACLGIVLVMVLTVPRDDTPKELRIDHIRVAQAARLATDLPIVAPALPSKNWWSNGAEYKSTETDGVATWYIGFVTANEKFIGILQGFDANQAWLKSNVGGASFVEEKELGGLSWKSYQRAEPSNPRKAKDEVFVLELDGDYLLLYGTGTKAEFELLISKLLPEIDRKYGT